MTMGPEGLTCLRIPKKTTFSRSIPMSSFKSSDSPQLKLIYEWGQGFEKKDAKILAKYLHKDFRHVTYPQSLNLPEKNREEWLEHISKVFSLWAETEVSYLSCRSSLPRSR